MDFKSIQEFQKFMNAMQVSRIGMAVLIKNALTNRDVDNVHALRIAMVTSLIDVTDDMEDSDFLKDEMNKTVTECIALIESQTGIEGLAGVIDEMRGKAKEMMRRVNEGEDILSKINLN